MYVQKIKILQQFLTLHFISDMQVAFY